MEDSFSRIVLSFATEDFATNYLLDEVIGRGTFGVVYRCVHLESGLQAAAKVVSKANLLTPVDVEDLRNEIEVLQQLAGHPRVLQLLDVFEDEAAVYLVTELCAGGDLLDILNFRSQGEFGETEAAEIFFQVAEAVAFCAEQGVIHRDVKPDNVFLLAPRLPGSRRASPGRLHSDSCQCTGAQGGKVVEQKKENRLPPGPGSVQTPGIPDRVGGLNREGSVCGDPRVVLRDMPPCMEAQQQQRDATLVKLGDWGLAVRIQPGHLLEGMAGSDPYLCPEMIRDELYGVEADVWSLGVLLFTLLSRRLPFQLPKCTNGGRQKGQTEIIRRTKESEQRQLFEAICACQLDFSIAPWPCISSEAKDLVCKLLSVDRHERPTARAVLRHPWLLDVADRLAPPKAPSPATWPPRVSLTALPSPSHGSHGVGLASCLSPPSTPPSAGRSSSCPNGTSVFRLGTLSDSASSPELPETPPEASSHPAPAMSHCFSLPNLLSALDPPLLSLYPHAAAAVHPLSGLPPAPRRHSSDFLSTEFLFSSSSPHHHPQSLLPPLASHAACSGAGVASSPPLPLHPSHLFASAAQVTPFLSSGCHTSDTARQLSLCCSSSPYALQPSPMPRLTSVWQPTLVRLSGPPVTSSSALKLPSPSLVAGNADVSAVDADLDGTGRKKALRPPTPPPAPVVPSPGPHALDAERMPVPRDSTLTRLGSSLRLQEFFSNYVYRSP
eukprot:TRINITY_DN38526_c0_g1_i1.p1 TRINITY_DN38526_c0_g1~~TRINITY_DN38526_c0_g1_i1.p1  ORF type:complete len:721 (+),score=111.64 TRINITY_DN38526_c0_g1_i1:112-2274(+)